MRHLKRDKVLNPTEQNLKLHNEIDALNGMLAKVSKELNKSQTEKHELAKMNYVDKEICLPKFM